MCIENVRHILYVALWCVYYIFVYQCFCQIYNYNLYTWSEGGDSTKYYPKSWYHPSGGYINDIFYQKYEWYSLESQKYVMKYRRRHI